MTITKPTNAWALAIYLLIENGSKGVEPKTYCKDYFHKFPTRLLEVEKSMDNNGKPRSLSLKIRRLPMTKKNRFGHTSTFTNYKSMASVSYLNNLIKKLNKHGINQPK